MKRRYDYMRPVPKRVLALQARRCALRSEVRDRERSLQNAALRYVRAVNALKKFEQKARRA